MSKIAIEREVIEQVLGTLLSTYPPSAEQYTKERDAITALRQALENQFNPDWDLLEATQESLREHMAEGQRLQKQCAAYKMLVEAQQEQLSRYRKQADEYQEAINTLASERQANAVLTEEVEELRAQKSQPVTERSDEITLNDIVRWAKSVPDNSPLYEAWARDNEAQQKQEPVAIRWARPGYPWTYEEYKPGVFYGSGVKVERLYKGPQVTSEYAAIRYAAKLGWGPKREWVGLTADEREQHRDEWFSNIHDKEIQAIEDKLKEKNHV